MNFASDRIADIWGERTPFDAGEEWPERIDMALEVAESEVERWVQSACVLCSNGCGVDPGSYADIDVCDTLFLVGHNVAHTQTVLWMRMLDRLKGPARPRLVVVDPRPTPAAREADVWLPIRNGTNVALLNGLLHEL